MTSKLKEKMRRGEVAIAVNIGDSVSQCAEATSMALGRGSDCDSPRHAAPSVPGSSACIGDPCETNIEGSIDRLFSFMESGLFSQKIPHQNKAAN